MGWRFVRQPNGLFARFSEVVDDFTDYNLTVGEAAELAAAESEYSVGKTKVLRAVDSPGLERWDEAIAIIERVHWDDALAAVGKILLVAGKGLTAIP